jgi:hypothetical protein
VALVVVLGASLPLSARSAAAQSTLCAYDLSGNLAAKASGALVAPQILRQPQQQVVEPGKQAAFSVLLADTQGVTYQWRFNGNPISGATSDTLSLTNVTAANEGQYSVVVTNSAGSATSANAPFYIDSDGDGMADSWEMANFGNLNQTATGDFDNDGVSNLDEFRDGTNPNSNASFRPRLTVTTDGGGTVTVSPAKASYNLGDVVTLTATAFAPNAFQGWTGGLTGTTNPATITMSANVTMSAHFLSTPTPPGLISWWRAEGNAQDATGTNNGTLNNGATFAAGKVGQAFSFDGVDDYFDVPDAPALRPASFTFESWVMVSAPVSGTPVIMAKPLGSGTLSSFALWCYNNALYFSVDSTTTNIFSSVPFTPNVGQWYHLALSFDDSTKVMSVYINGALAGSTLANLSIGYDNHAFLLGCDNQNGTNQFFFNGRIDEAALYNRALTQDEIAAIYEADLTGKSAGQPNITTASTLPNGGFGIAYSQQLATSLGTPPYSYALTDGVLPPGLSLSAAGLISGTPTGSGLYYFSIQVADAAGQSSAQIFSLKIVAATEPPPGIAAWWRAENNAQDSIGPNNGALHNGATFAAGKVGQAFSFDGVDDYFDVPDAPALRPASFTFESWVMFNAPVSGTSVMMAKPLGSGTASSYALWCSDDVLFFSVDSTTTGIYSSVFFNPNVGQWYHLALSFDDSTKVMSVYINGALAASIFANLSIGYDNHAFLLGCDNENGTNQFFFNGRIDEAAFYNRPLTPAEIASIYNSGFGGKATTGPIINTPAALPDGLVGQPYAQTIASIRTTGSTSYSVTAGALPPGLTLNGSGSLSGTPTTAGSYNFTIRLTDSSSYAEQVFTLQIDAPPIPPNGIVSWWRAEGNAQDSIGTNHGTLTNGATFAAGKVGQSFFLDGINDSVDIPDSPSLRPASMTFEAWVIFNTTSPTPVIMSKPLGSAALASYALWIDHGTLEAVVGDTSGYGPVLSYALSPLLGTWYHVAYSFDNTTKQQALYVNGAVVASGVSNKSISYDSQPFLLGRDIQNGSSGFYFSGRIDEAAFYNRALTATEIASVFNTGSAGKAVSGPYFATPPTLPTAITFTPYSQTLTTLRGTAPIAYSVIGGSLPAGLTFSSSGLLSGAPTVAGNYSFTVRATDSNNLTVDETFTLQVLPKVLPPAGIVSWWRAENNAQDSIGTNHGTLTNGATFAAGEVGNAFSLDGTDDYVSIPSINIGTKYSVEFWVFPTRNIGFEHLVSNGASSTNFGALYFNGDHIEYWEGPTNPVTRTAAGSVPRNAWSHVALTYENGYDLIYINGVPAASTAFHSETFNNALEFGYAVTGGGIDNHFKGLLDEVSLYNRALSSSEIIALYSAGVLGKTTAGPYFNTSAQLPDGALGQPYNQTIASLRGSGTVTEALLSGALPPGITIASNGTLSGTPTTAGNYAFTIRATDSAGLFADQTFNLRILVQTRIPLGLVSWWKAENNALDSFGTNNGTLVNGVTFAGGQVGQAFSLNGTSQYVSVPDAPSLRPSSSLSMDAWFLLSSSPTGIQRILRKPLGNQLESYSIWLDSGALRAGVSDTGNGNWLTYTFNLVVGRWYHVAYTLNTSTQWEILYLNGIPVVSGAEPKTPLYDTQPFVMGADTGGGTASAFFPGEIDEVSLYNRAITAQEVNGIYNAGVAGKRLFFPFETWKYTNLGDPDALATDDPDHDGLNNLLEYAFNSNPTSPASDNTPTVSLDATYLSITYTKVLSATDLTYSIEQSTDLAQWQKVTPTNEILFDNGTIQTIKAKVPRSNAGAGGKLFLHVRVDAAN